MTSYLLDTNSISETRRKLPDPNFDQFFGSLQPPQLFLSVMTVGELRKGVANQRKKDPSTAINLELWVNKIEHEFSERILDVDLETARIWGELSAAGRTRPAIDTLLAATALRYGLTVLTRNVADFQDLPIRWVNPWSV